MPQFQPMLPNFLRPLMHAWNTQRPKRRTRKSLGRLHESSVDWLKLVHARNSSCPRDFAGSFEILMEFCRIASGIVCCSGVGGGSADKKQRKSLLVSGSKEPSSLRSSALTHPDMRWMFCKNTQPPSFMHRSSASSATGSWPCPMEMLMNLPFSIV